MNPGTAIACRTRYRRRKLFEDALIMSRKKKKARERESISSKGEDGSGKMEPVSPFSAGLSMNSERVSSESGFQPLGGHENDPIEISDGDNGSETEEGLRESENDIFCVEVEKKSEEDEGSFVLGDKVVNFDDDNCGCVSDKPDVLTIDDDEEDDLLSSSTDSEDKETSDEDFLVADDDDGFETEGSTTSDESNGDDGRGGDDVRGVQRKILKGMVRKMESDAESSEIRERKGERKGNEQVDVEELWRMADCTSATSSKSEIYKKEGQHVAHKDEEKRVQSVIADSEVFGVHVKNSGCSMSSEALEHMKKSDSATLQKQIGDPAVVEKSGRNKNINVDLVDIDDIKRKGNQQNKGTGLRSVSFRPKNQAKIGDSAKIVMEKDKEGEPKYWFHSNNRKKDGDGAVDDETGDKELYEVTRMPSTLKNKCYQIFTECFMGKNDSVKDNSYKLDEKDDVVAEGETQALVSREPTPLNCSFMNEEEPVEKSEEDELDMLWAEMDMLLRAEEIGTQVNNMGTNEATENGESSAPKCKHDTIFNEQIGIYCRWCGWTVTEIKYITPPFVDSERYGGRMASSSEGKTSLLDGAMLNESGDDDSEAIWSQKEGTVWDLIPDIKQSLYPHQQEGYEFIWKNLAGTIDLAKLKSVDPCNEGGCIISHAPGTGKTRLTMVFLQSYLQLFPKCLPVIIAPSSILLTWEDELRKWKLGIPFHNLNSAELSGNEQLISEVDWYGNQRQNKDAIRMVKLCSWYKEKSILLISYNLYEKLAGATSVGGGGKDKNNKNFGKKKRAKTREYIESGMGKVLRDYPGLLVLDEGHTPRNQNSYIWKVLSESRTQKRILLSGTPFQNNFLELYNILCLMKPSFPDSIPQELKKFCQSRLMQGGKASKEMNWEHVSSGNPADVKINQLKLLMNPFVHVHKGSILEKNLPGLRECVLVLKPDILQQETLESIECSQNVLNFEHKLALVSVHPSLFLSCSLSEKEESIIDKDRLEKIRLNPYAGVKTKFLIEFIRLCDAVNEKVLVFSQFIDTLDLIKEQLESALNWTVGMEVLYMYGRLDQKQKQSLIYSFNDANSRAKVLLASIKASSEGINLVGASRVVLLDVVWNPSVERQAICRAYRLGQKKVVFTYHLLAQDTPECTKYCKQAEKNRLSELVFSNKNAESDKLKSSGVMLEDFEDRVLDVMVQHEKLKDMIGECLIQPRKRDLEILGP